MTAILHNASCHLSSVISYQEFSALLAPLHPAPHFAIAISGGADSMALALLAHQAGLSFTALSIDHGLQPASAGVADQVKRWLEPYGIAHHTLRWSPLASRANLQARAREARYRLLSEWCLAQGVRDLLTAHHRDDQAETLLLRLKRGSHITGLAGMAPVQELPQGIRLLRPLLSVAKARLIATLRAHEQRWAEDATNAMPVYERNRLRALLHALPDYEQHVGALATSAERLRLLRDKAEQELQAVSGDCVTYHADGSAILRAAPFNALPPDQAALTLSHLLARIGGTPYPPRFAQVETALERMRHDRRVTLNGCLITWVNRESLWRITPEKPHHGA